MPQISFRIKKKETRIKREEKKRNKIKTVYFDKDLGDIKL